MVIPILLLGKTEGSSDHCVRYRADGDIMDGANMFGKGFLRRSEEHEHGAGDDEDEGPPVDPLTEDEHGEHHLNGYLDPRNPLFYPPRPHPGWHAHSFRRTR